MTGRAEPLPPYSYVPGGRFPHPTRDPAGHSYGTPPERPAVPDPANWRSCLPYLRGIELFNHGYYWEAHEVWEGLWHACGRSGCAADFFKGLIKLAAAGVKVREGRPAGVRNHARRAAELLRRVASKVGGAEARYFGLCLADLIHFAAAVADRPPPSTDPEAQVKVVFDFVLQPS